MATNLFDKSKKVAVAKKADKHEVVTIAKTYEKDLTRMAEIDAKMAELEAEKATLDAGVREEAKNAMAKLYDEKNCFPGSLKVVAGKRSFLFITSDKYIKIDEDRAGELTKKYGQEVVTEKTVYTLNPDMVQKYGQEISDLIMASKKIATDDKENLIESATAWMVAKGTIEKLRSKVFAKFNICGLLEDIRPIYMVKGNKEE
jgi:hypothetical protein